MDNFAAARSQMGMSLGFHIVFAVIGVALPLMMTIAEWRFRATGDAAYLLVLLLLIFKSNRRSQTSTDEAAVRSN
jgi:cytochrome bd-type quinol oxidase subunit 1